MLHPKFLIALIGCFLSLSAHAQLSGTVTDDTGFPLSGATVKWDGDGGTVTDIDGRFTLAEAAGNHRFTVSYLGFVSQEFHYYEVADSGMLTVILLEGGTDLAGIEVTARDRGSRTAVNSLFNDELLSAKELKKAPCCALSESFENSPVVDLAYGDPLTGRREIQMLGLRGTYTLLTLENRPFMSGLASPYALDIIPGPWVSGIQIGKGAGALTNGAGGLTGNINSELRKPDAEEPLYVNIFGSSQGRGEANVGLNGRFNEKLTAGLLLHGSLTDNGHDFDGDGFQDMPGRETGVALGRLFYRSENLAAQWNVLGSRDRRSAGQLGLDPYRIDQANDHLELFGKVGLLNLGRDHRSLGIVYSAAFHQLDNRYGNRLHRGEQQTYFLNAIYQTELWDERHGLTLGASGQQDLIDESFSQEGKTDFDRNERVLGAYGEYTFQSAAPVADRPGLRWTVVAGLRLDHHSLGGVQASPRLHLRLNPDAVTALRLSAGRGWRSPNVLVENLNWLPGSRQVVSPTPDAANPGFAGLETAWNFGASLTRQLQIGQREGEFVVDFYRTAFTNQIVVDAEGDLSTLNLYQLGGQSFANGAMVTLDVEVAPRIDAKIAYKYSDVRTSYRERGLRELPLVPTHRALATLGYDGRRIKAHLNYQWVGEQRLIDFDRLPASVNLVHPQRAPAFGLLNAQVTCIANARLEVYGGGENLTQVRQRNAIIGAEAPFEGEYFDASQVYQPLVGRRFYLGLRYTITKK